MQKLLFNPKLKLANLSWHKETSTFVGEISCILHENKQFVSQNDISIENIETHNCIVFKFDKCDIQNGEIQGWRYKAIEGHTKNCSLLIIND